jgi:alkylation response protein AidB-like acyl-CoA dehydrogenase
MPFFQEPPRLGNQYDDDALLREYVERVFPDDARRELEPHLREMGELSAGELADLSQRALDDEPELVHFDPWGRRVDEIRVPEAWTRMARVACERGLVAIPYERRSGALSRVHQFALAYLFAPSSLVYTCPLAMTDGAARTLQVHGNRPLLETALPRLVSRDPGRFWTSGQWMTERIGGSDVGATETVARREGAAWRLHGTKWFTSATTSEMALTLARPEGNPPGGKGLALFYLELRNGAGTLNGIRINRLKDKLGTRMLPTAELELEGALAQPVAGLTDGVKAISPMLQITRTWNAICAIGSMRRAVALARDYAGRRRAFGAPLVAQPLQLEVLAGLQARLEADFLLTFRAVELLGQEEAGEASDSDRLLARLLQPIVKLVTGKDAVAVASEALEAFGGAGYIEDTGLPVLLRDAQVLPIWEGTTNVLSLDVLRAIGDGEAIELLRADAQRRVLAATAHELKEAGAAALKAMEQAVGWARGARGDRARYEGGARALAFTLGRAYALALVVEHAQWLCDRDGRGAPAARRCAAIARRLAAAGPSSLEALTPPGDASAIAGGA